MTYASPAVAVRRRRRPSPLSLVVFVTAVAGAAAVAATQIFDRGEAKPAISVALGHGWLLLVLLTATIAGELTAVRLRQGEAREELTLVEAAALADALLLRPREAVLVLLGGLLVAGALARRPAAKILFTFGSSALAICSVVGVIAGLSDHSGGFSGGTVGGLLIGAMLFAGIELVFLAVVLRAVSGIPLGGTLRSGYRLTLVAAVSTAAIGSTAVAVSHSSPLLLPFALLPAAALTYAYGAVAQEGDQRLRSAQLLALSHTLAMSLDVEDLVTSFLGFLREAFHAGTAFVVLESAGREETVVIADESGVGVRAAMPPERMLLATVEGTTLLESVAIGEGTARVLVTPLDADGRRLGVVALTEPVVPRRRLSLTSIIGTRPTTAVLGPAEETLIGPLASALAVALRGAEHLSRVVEETGKLKVVVEHSSDGIVVVDGEGAVTLWSPAMEAITGIGESGAIGRRVSDLVVASDAKNRRIDALRAGWDLLTPAEPRVTVETTLTRPDGEQRLVRWAHAAVFDEARDTFEPVLLRDVVLVHDVTRERAVDRLKQDFIATVSHELRSPLTPIKGYVDLLRRKGEEMTPEKRRDALDVVNDRVAHLTRIVEDVLLASRVAVPASTVQMSVGDLAALTRKSCGDFAVEASRLVLDIPDTTIPVRCDPVRVVQVASNLVSNALKYSPSEAQVFVVVRAEGATARLSVTDRGRGIPADQLEAVFEKFHRVEDPLRMTTSGTGLGLYIARQLAEAMGGRLTLTSAYGVGSTFTFALPLAADDDAHEESGPSWPTRRYGRPPFPNPRLAGQLEAAADPVSVASATSSATPDASLPGADGASG
ncbi:MAG TPA: ATP-binding protein [Mycobacteriales bacterium]|nr:ATP-binding protein [Mycobacteriales bacterium]